MVSVHYTNSGKRYSVFLCCVALLLTSCFGDGGGSNSSSGADEGTLSAPVTLTLGTPRAGSIGKSGSSYYQFTTAGSGNYRISLTKTQSDLYWELHANNTAGSFEIDYCDSDVTGPDDEVCISTNLSASKTYYLVVGNWDDVASTYTLQVDQVTTTESTPQSSPPPPLQDEGTQTNPIPLSIGVPHTGSIASTGRSYYQFTALTQKYHRISVTNVNINTALVWHLDVAPAPVEHVQTCNNFWGLGADEVCETSNPLTPGTDYIVAVIAGGNDDSTFEIRVDELDSLPVAIPVYSPDAVRFVPDGTWRLCKFDSLMGHDMDDELSISGRAIIRTTYHVASTDGTCTGTRAVATTISYTRTDNGLTSSTKYPWTDGATITAPPRRADVGGNVYFSNVPASSVRAVPQSDVATENWLWFVDASIWSAPRLYHGSHTPAAQCAGSNTTGGFPQCLLATEYYKRD